MGLAQSILVWSAVYSLKLINLEHQIILRNRDWSCASEGTPGWEDTGHWGQWFVQGHRVSLNHISLDSSLLMTPSCCAKIHSLKYTQTMSVPCTRHTLSKCLQTDWNVCQVNFPSCYNNYMDMIQGKELFNKWSTSLKWWWRKPLHLVCF